MVWKYLKHEKIVPLLGITSTPLQIISKWMPDGILTEYVRKYQDVDRCGLVGIHSVVLYHMFTLITSYLMLLKVFNFSTPKT